MNQMTTIELRIVEAFRTKYGSIDVHDWPITLIEAGLTEGKYFFATETDSFICRRALPIRGGGWVVLCNVERSDCKGILSKKTFVDLELKVTSIVRCEYIDDTEGKFLKIIEPKQGGASEPAEVKKV